MKMVKGPGKFEGNPAYIEWLWDNVVMDGSADDSFDMADYGYTVDVIRLTPNETVDLETEGLIDEDELDNVHAVAIWESSDGFVYYRTFSDDESLEKWTEENE